MSSLTSSGGARPSQTASDPKARQMLSARRQSPRRERTATAAAIVAPSTRLMAGPGARAGAGRADLVADDEREDRTGQTHPEPDAEGQRQDEDRTRDGEPQQPEPDDQRRAPRSAERTGERRRERGEDPHAQDRIALSARATGRARCPAGTG